MKKVYLSHPITELNRQIVEAIFELAENNLTERGYKVVNPLKIGTSWNLSRAENMKLCMLALPHCDLIYRIPSEYPDSEGVECELIVAKNCDIGVLTLKPDTKTLNFVNKIINSIPKIW